MAVSLPLTNEEADVVRSAAKASKTTFPVNGRTLTLTPDNFEAIRDAVKALHAKKRAIKTRTVIHLEMCFNLEAVLNKMERLAGTFGVDPATFAPDNDNTIGIVVDNTKPSPEMLSGALRDMPEEDPNASNE